ncbi:MAG: lantibiotic dehydratase, partial [Holophagales bacterium]|nr:lantibiotic dehydratase [Holophagales bacterium]
METATVTAGKVARRAAFFPRFVVRVAGLPASVVEGLRAERSVARLERLFRTEARIQEVREAVSSGLHELIGRQEAAERRKQLINLRRAVHKKRSVAADKLAELPGELADRARELFSLKEEAEQLRRAFGVELAGEHAELRERFRRELGSESFQNSLLLSSRVLFGAQERYFRADPSALRTKEKQIERGLLKYFTRMSMKATPFATFCSVVPGTFVEVPEEEVLEEVPGTFGESSLELQGGPARCAVRFAGDPRPLESL